LEPFGLGRALAAARPLRRASVAGARASKATVQRLLREHALQPQRVACYLERRDPKFERKTAEVVAIYTEVAEQLRADMMTLSVDEKPGMQAIANTAPDLPPVPCRHAAHARDHEYRRLGSCSIIAGLDLGNGQVIARVERRHRSREFVAFLRNLHAAYPPEVKIRLILDNHPAHIFRETRAFLATVPNRFVFVHTPKHGSWLNLIETLFARMARTFLRHVRIENWDELRERILLGIAEINAHPVIHRWGRTQMDIFH
jgi:transposase